MPASCGPSRPFGIDAVLNRALLSIGFTAGQPAEAVLGLPGARTGRRGTEILHPVDMLYKITVEPDYLNAELFNRETMDETREFLQIVANAAVKHRRSQVLISVHASNPVFTVIGPTGFTWSSRGPKSPLQKNGRAGKEEVPSLTREFRGPLSPFRPTPCVLSFLMLIV